MPFDIRENSGSKAHPDSPEQEACHAQLARDFWSDWSNGNDEACNNEGTLRRARFVDSVGRTTLEQDLKADGQIDYKLSRQNIGLSFDKDGHLQGYSTADHSYSFDTSLQNDLLEKLPKGPVFQIEGGSLVVAEPVKSPDPIDLGKGLKAVPSERGMLMQLPDGGPTLLLNRDGGVKEIRKEGEYAFDLSGKKLSNPDPNVPKDARLSDPVAIHQDAVLALNALKENQYSSYFKSKVADHIKEMPEDKRLAYALKLQKEVAEMTAPEQGVLSGTRLDLRFTGNRLLSVNAETWAYLKLKSESVNLYADH